MQDGHIDNEQTQWVKVMRSEDRFKVNLASITLKEMGIHNVIMSKKDSTYVMIGFFELYVPQSMVVKAQRYLKELNG